ncbi:AAA family ATPase [Oleidesulfovibrio alaskensis]|uniref:AAA family ATPase n=1 Tax=Oleidesulfovibrio alaskensis TaxID=58180 RepID=UPI001A5AC818|nr:AAA family ATPase [Oleidesulfovibrio alaskensis]MBL3583757.1 AAA family ATPase [Oleidesulfovibrio alaskensis]
MPQKTNIQLSMEQPATVHIPELMPHSGFSKCFLDAVEQCNVQGHYVRSELERMQAFLHLVGFYIDLFPGTIKQQLRLVRDKDKELEKVFHGTHLALNPGTYDPRNPISGIEVLERLAQINKSPLEHAKIIGSLWKIRYDTFLRSFSTEHHPNSRVTNVPKECFAPDNITLGNLTLKHKKAIPLLQKERSSRFYLCIYQSNTNEIRIFPAGLVHDEEAQFAQQIIGAPFPPCFFNQNRLASTSTATVIWPMDFMTSDSLHTFFTESTAVSQKNVIVTGHYGGHDMQDALPLDVLAMKDVILMPELSHSGMRKIIELGNRCSQANANSVRIYPFPLLHFNAPKLDDMRSAVQNAWERQLLTHACDLERVDYPPALFRKIQKESMTLPEFIAWGKECALFQLSAHEKEKNILNEDLNVTPVSFFPSTEHYRPNSASRLYDLDTLISPESRTLLWAPTDIGKSLFALHLACALAFKTTMTVFTAKKSRKVLLFDGETGPTQWDTRTQNIHGNYPIALEDKDNLLVTRTKACPAYENMDLFSAQWQEKLLALWKEKGINVLILDNLMSLCPQAFQSTANADKFIQFIKRLEISNIAVIIIHHSNKKGDATKGAYEFNALFQNEFSLKKTDPNDEYLEKARQLGGALCILTAVKNKLVPELDNKEFTLHLPLKAGRWTVLSQPGADIPTSTPGNITENAACASLSTRGREVYEYFRANQAKTNTHGISRKEIEKHLGCGSDTARKYINELREASLLEACSTGRTATYRLCSPIAISTS